MVLRDFKEPLNILTDSQYAEKDDLHIETAEFKPNVMKFTSLFIQVEDIIRNRLCPICT